MRGRNTAGVRTLGGKTNHGQVLAGKCLRRTIEGHWDASILFPLLNSGFLCLLNSKISSQRLERALFGRGGTGSPAKTV